MGSKMLQTHETRIKRARRQLKSAQINSTKQALERARPLLKADIKAQGAIAPVARDIGVTWGTVAKICNGDTREPRFSTLLTIYRYYGLKMEIRDAETLQ